MGKKEASKTVKKIASTVAKGAEAGTERALVVAKGAAAKTKNAVSASQKAIVEALDQDGNGVLDSTDLILMALKVPGVKINYNFPNR